LILNARENPNIIFNQSGLNTINNTTQLMPESQGSPQNTKEAPPKRDNKNPKARHKLSSEECLRSYLTGIPEKSWKAPSLSSVKYALKKLYKLLMVILLLFSAIFIIMILFPKLIPILIPITLIIIAIIIASLAIILVIMIAIASIKYAIKYAIEYIILIFSFRRLVRILPALINELKGKLPKDVEEDAQKYLQNFPCMEHFRGNAAKALSRISQSTFTLMLIDSILLPTIPFLVILFLIPILIILHYLHYLLGLKIPSTSILISILITGIKSAITKTVVDVALLVLGTILSIVMGLFLFSSQARFDADTLRFVYDVKFTVLGRFIVAVFLIIISLIIISVIPPIIAIIITVPVITALIISITVYVILVSAVIDYMQLARNNQGEN